jgi:hypothetical protein
MAKNTNSDKTLRVRRGRVDSVSLYEVKENELEILEKGETTGIQLNFAIFLFSIAFSGILTLCTATFKSTILQNAFLFTTIIGVILGLYLIVIWWRGRRSIRTIIKTIKDRMPPEFVDEGEEEIEVIKDKIGTPKDTDIVRPEG